MIDNSWIGIMLLYRFDFNFIGEYLLTVVSPYIDNPDLLKICVSILKDGNTTVKYQRWEDLNRYIFNTHSISIAKEKYIFSFSFNFDSKYIVTKLDMALLDTESGNVDCIENIFHSENCDTSIRNNWQLSAATRILFNIETKEKTITFPSKNLSNKN